MPNHSQEDRIRELFQKYIDDSGTPEDMREFWQLLEDSKDDDVLREELLAFWPEPGTAQSLPPLSRQRMSAEQLKKRILRGEDKQDVPSGKRSAILRFSVAAAVAVLIVAALSFLYWHPFSKKIPAVAVTREKDIPPGGNKAVLTLANGNKIVLDSAQNGTLSMQGNTRVTKLKSGQLSYQGVALASPGSHHADQKILYNTITTPKGGQYQVILSDGTKVWLNAGSSIRFPNQFIGKERKVEFTGEAYFEVAKDAKMPFAVMANGVRIDVLGTHFDLMTYEDEASSKVTLLEGAVSVKNSNGSLLLKPGQQAVWKSDGQMTKVEGADLQGAIAWTRNEFWFDDDTIESVMRQLSRWYNVEVKIEGNIPQHFAGFIPRNVSFSEAFGVLQATGRMHYKMQDNQIIVSP